MPHFGKSGERFLCLSKLNESILIKGNEYSFSTNECHNYIEKGYQYQESFTKQFLPLWEYNIKGININLRKILYTFITDK